ncbi:hypothetical protein RB614_32075 [Phytohabitans sp. ZYX-F-186]|uniref:Lipoprotein n=1 Tax=Phytohabitans maris TaxID=3071409 RepID=A0ABU0ZQ59_9ACTN|nr:hypothetical protein [Phytohabitans sp. ZYX-F-186]MDQ7909169.1 hypothetical protein [Phytohabitans sp. ZYX-F-186]
MSRFPALSVLVAALLAGCSAGDAQPEPPFPPDSGLRPVTMPYGDGIAYVQEETSAQLLCQALDPARWRDVLGAPVSRTVQNSLGRSQCVLDNASLAMEVSTELFLLDEIGPGLETVHGHPARIGADSEKAMHGAAELLPAAAVGLDSREGMNLYVRVVAKQGAEPGLPGIVRRTIEALMPAILDDRPKTPGWPVRFEHTGPVEGVALLDLPAPVQARVLCSALHDDSGTGPAAHEADLGRTNACLVVKSGETRQARLDIEYELRDSMGGEFTIAGLPARVNDDEASIVLRTVPGEPSGTIYHLLVLRRQGLGVAALRVWAEAIASLLRVGPETPISPGPAAAGEAKRATAFACPPRFDADPALLRQGPVIPVDGGEFTVATLPTGKIVTCDTSDRSSGEYGPYRLPAGAKTAPAGTQNVSGRPGHLGWGWAAPEVAKVEIVFSGGQVLPAQVAGGAYAYYAPNSDFMARPTVRAYDAAGNQIG